jgi:hypothetical protein
MGSHFWSFCGENQSSTCVWHDTDLTENVASKNSSIVERVLVATVTLLPSRCLTTIGGTHTDARTDGRDLWSTSLSGVRCHDKHTKFYEDWFRHSGIDGGGGGEGIHIRHGDLISLPLLFKIRKWANKWVYGELNPCGGGVEYLHRDPTSRKRRRNGAKKGRAIA